MDIFWKIRLPSCWIVINSIVHNANKMFYRKYLLRRGRTFILVSNTFLHACVWFQGSSGVCREEIMWKYGEGKWCENNLGWFMGSLSNNQAAWDASWWQEGLPREQSLIKLVSEKHFHATKLPLKYLLSRKATYLLHLK